MKEKPNGKSRDMEFAPSQDTARLRWIDLPLTALDGWDGTTRIIEHLKELPGVWCIAVDLKTNVVSVEFDVRQTGITAIIKAIGEVGYSVGRSTTQLSINDIRCPPCAVTLEEALNHTPGVLSASVNPSTGLAQVEHVPGLVNIEQMELAIRSAGYTVGLPVVSIQTSIDRD